MSEILARNVNYYYYYVHTPRHHPPTQIKEKFEKKIFQLRSLVWRICSEQLIHVRNNYTRKSQEKFNENFASFSFMDTLLKTRCLRTFL